MKYFFNLVISLIFGWVFWMPGCYAQGIFRCQEGSRVFYQDYACPSDAEQQILDNHHYPPTVPSQPTNTSSQDMTSNSGQSSTQTKGKERQIIIERAPDSHFYVNGTINGNPIRFLVDTGASLVAVPDEMMLEMGLRNESQVNVRSAAGIVKAYKTTIKELKLGDFTFNNVMAETMPGSQPLLGMNVLSLFDVTLKNDQLILSPKSN